MFKDEIKYYKSFTSTFQAKAVISKSKLLSKLTYMCSVHVMPIAFQNSLNKALLSFLIPSSTTKNMTNSEIFDKLTKFAAPKHLGGYGVDQIAIHVDLLLLKPVMRYVKCKIENVILSNDLYFVEYYLGFQLARRFGFIVNNRTPHASQPNILYNYVLEVIRTCS